MKILLDSSLGLVVKNGLIKAGYDVIWVGDWGKDPGDEVILEQAHREKRFDIVQN